LEIQSSSFQAIECGGKVMRVMMCDQSDDSGAALRHVCTHAVMLAPSSGRPES